MSALLYDSESLTREEQALREELLEWCEAQLRRGVRPGPLQAALQITTNAARGGLDDINLAQQVLAHERL